MLDISSQRAKADAFRSLHDRRKILLLPNVWDVGTARIFANSGARAIGTTSAGIATSFGHGDGESISQDDMFGTISRIAHAVDLPVTADIEGGYGESADAVAESTRAAINAGVAGINVEDAAWSSNGTRATERLLSPDVHAARIAAARDAAGASGVQIVINAVIHTYLVLAENSDRFDDTVERARRYRDAGADCVYVPRLNDRAEIAALVDRVDCPVNLLTVAGLPPIAELEALGVARLSMGFAAARAVIGFLQQIAEDFLTARTYTPLVTGALSNEQAEALVTSRR